MLFRSGYRCAAGCVPLLEEDFEKQLAEQLPVRGAARVHALRFGVVFAQQPQDTEHPAVVPPCRGLLQFAQSVGVVHSQDAYEFRVRGKRNSLVAAEPPQVVDAENFAELIEKGQNRYQQGVVFGVAGEMVGDAQGLFEVLSRDGLAEFEVIEILRDADVLFDVCVGDFLRSFR